MHPGSDWGSSSGPCSELPTWFGFEGLGFIRESLAKGFALLSWLNLHNVCNLGSHHLHIS